MRSTTVCALSISVCGTAGTTVPRADWATYESTITETRAKLLLASSSEISSNGFNPHAGVSIAIADCTSTRTSPV